MADCISPELVRSNTIDLEGDTNGLQYVESSLGRQEAQIQRDSINLDTSSNYLSFDVLETVMVPGASGLVALVAADLGPNRLQHQSLFVHWTGFKAESSNVAAERVPASAGQR